MKKNLFCIILLFYFLMSTYADQLSKDQNSKIVTVEVNLDYQGKNYKLIYTGSLISDQGHVIIPFLYDRKSITDTRLWYKQTEYSSAILDYDSQVKFLLLKFEPEGKTDYFKISTQPITSKTAKITVITTSNEENFFTQYKDSFQFSGYYFGSIDFFVISSLNLNNFFLPGSVAIDKSGSLVAILGDGNNRFLFATYDLAKNVTRMLHKATQPSKTKNDEDKPYIGFIRNYVNKDYAELRGLPPNSVLVTAVFKDSPAEKGNLKVGDLITKVDKIPLQGVNQNVERHFAKLLNPGVGENIEFQVLREGKTLNLVFTFQKKPEPKELKMDEFGISFKEITQSEYYTQNLFKEQGVFISKIEPGSPAATSSEFGAPLLSTNDVILEINNTPIKTIDDVVSAINAAKNSSKNVALFLVQRDLNTKYAAMKIKNNEVRNEK